MESIFHIVAVLSNFNFWFNGMCPLLDFHGRSSPFGYQGVSDRFRPHFLMFTLPGVRFNFRKLDLLKLQLGIRTVNKS